MKVIFTSPKGKRYMVRPCTSGLDYEILKENPNLGKPKRKGKNKGELITDEWKFIGKYSSTLWYAIKLAIEDMMRDPEEEVVITANWGTLMQQVSGIEDCINAYVGKIDMEVKNGNQTSD